MASNDSIQLGDEVKDTISGLVGVVISITNWINGCQRIGVQPRELKDGRPVEMCVLDVQQLEVTIAAPPVVKPPTGGPTPAPIRQQDDRLPSPGTLRGQ